MPSPEVYSPAEKEKNRESREQKEKEIDPELLAAATLERADLLVKEVKSNKQQIANILLHMTQVQQMITAIRKQLQLQQQSDTSTSLVHDEQHIAKLKKQIQEHHEELLHMQDDLVTAYEQDLQKQHPEWSEETRKEVAHASVAKLLAQV